MARFEITAPDGKRYEITAPDNASEAQVLEYAKANYASAPATQPAEPEAPKRSLPEQVVRAVGRTARAGALGIGRLSMGDALGFRTSDAINNALDKLGLPRAENENERIAEDVAAGMAGAGGMVGLGRGMAGAGNALVQRIGQLLSTAPGTQVAAGGTGSGAASVVREEGGGPGAQLAAGVAGAMVPALPAAVKAAARSVMRGGEAGRQRVIENIKTFEDAGAGTPSVGQATESRAARATESILAKTPGAAGRMTAKAEAEALGLGTKVEDMAAKLAGRTGAAPAGRAIKGGLEHFVDDFKGTSGKLYDALDTHIPPDTQVSLPATRKALSELNADIPMAPELSEWFKNHKIVGIGKAVESDVAAKAPKPTFLQVGKRPAPSGHGSEPVVMLGPDSKPLVTGQTQGKPAGLPYEALKKLRTLVGNEISDGALTSDVPRSKWKALYAALSRDMGAAAKAAGPKAEAAFVRANNFHRAGMQRIEDVLQPIVAKGDPEDIFQAAISGTKEGASTISGVMKSLPPESRKVVTATMLRRLGLAQPGKQNELGEVFSSETFLTNWNRISQDAKRVLFAPLSDQHRADLDKIAKVAANMREGSKVFANPSGTGQVVTAQVPAWTAIALALTGNPGSAALVGGAPIAANYAARVMTSPKTVRWLAQTSRMPVEQLPAQLNNLFQQSLYMNGDERRDVRAFVKAIREANAALKAGQEGSSK